MTGKPSGTEAAEQARSVGYRGLPQRMSWTTGKGNDAREPPVSGGEKRIKLGPTRAHQELTCRSL